MRDTTIRKHCIIICNENEDEYSQLGISRNAKILKSIAEDDNMGIDKIFRLPAFDKNKSEKKWIEIIKYYKLGNQIDKFYIDNLEQFKELNPKFVAVLTTHLVDLITNENLNIFNYKTNLTLSLQSKKEHWEIILGRKFSNKVEEVTLTNEYKNTPIDDLNKRINWDCDVFFINSVRISNDFPDLFSYPQKWSKSICLEYGRIENVINFFKVKHPNIKKYKAKESNLRAWNIVLSMFNIKITRELLEKKYNCKFDIKP